MAMYHNEITKEFLSPNLINQHPIFKERSSQSREPKSTNAQIISNPVEEVNGVLKNFSFLLKEFFLETNNELVLLIIGQL